MIQSLVALHVAAAMLPQPCCHSHVV